MRLFLEELESRCLFSVSVTPFSVSGAPVVLGIASTVKVIPVDDTILPIVGVIGEPIPSPIPIQQSNPPSGPVVEPALANPTVLTPVGGITFGPDGNLWFPAGDQIGELNPTTGVIQEFNLPSIPLFENQIVAGPDGNLWFAAWNRIDKFDPTTSTVQEYMLPGPFPGMSGGSITFDKNGFLWFRSAGSLGCLNPATGEIQQFLGGALGYNVYGETIAAGPDGAIWFGDGQSGQVDRFDPITQTTRVYQVPGQSPFGIGIGPDGYVYFTTSFKSQIGRINPATGAVQMIGNAPTSDGSIQAMQANWTPQDSLVFGTDGIVWTTGAGEITKFNTGTGDVQNFNVASSIAMALDANGNLWFPYFPQPVSYTDHWVIGVIAEFNPDTGALQTFDLATRIQPPADGSTGNGSTASGTTFDATAGINFETAVATFTPQTPVASPGSAYSVSVDWGDGTNSNLVLTVTSNDSYAVVAGHTYTTSGTFSIKVTISLYTSSDSLNADPVTVFSTANVAANNWDFNPLW
jgi:streptogramin lyase